VFQQVFGNPYKMSVLDTRQTEPLSITNVQALWGRVGKCFPSRNRRRRGISSALPENHAADTDFDQASPVEHILERQNSPSRRLHARVEALGGVYVYWRSAGHEHLAPVRNLSMGGLFIETDTPPVAGMSAELDFLVQEGQIRAEAVVRHAEPGRGLGLRFTAVRNEDRLRLEELVKRLRGLNG
jgi:hypothetical protein